MGYDIDLVDENGKICTVGMHREGGTYVLGGTRDASLSVTYNYAPFLYKDLDHREGIRWLYGKTGINCIERLEKAIKALGTKRSNDYWDATAGNAGYVLSILLKWAKECPNGRFKGD